MTNKRTNLMGRGETESHDLDKIHRASHNSSPIWLSSQGEEHGARWCPGFESPQARLFFGKSDLFSGETWGVGLGGGVTPGVLCCGFLSCAPWGSAHSQHCVPVVKVGAWQGTFHSTRTAGWPGVHYPQGRSLSQHSEDKGRGPVGTVPA